VARKVVVAVIGATVLALGVALIVLPGPAVVVIPLGLAILGTEFLWARWLAFPVHWRNFVRQTVSPWSIITCEGNQKTRVK
jgi:putative transmembrane protein PGPGW